MLKSTRHDCDAAVWGSAILQQTLLGLDKACCQDLPVLENRYDAIQLHDL